VGNILVCDDERSICEMLDIALRREGHKVETVTSGELAKRKLDSAIYDVIVTDIKMPRTDGIEVLRHMRNSAVCKDALVIVVSSSDSASDRAAVKTLGFNGYFRKPSVYAEFMKLGPMIRELLKGATGGEL